MATKRPALSAILGEGRPIEAATSTPAPVALQQATTSTAKKAQAKVKKPKPAKKTSRRAAGHVQLNVLLPESLRKAAKMKALQEDRDLSEVIEGLLRKWLGK